MTLVSTTLAQLPPVDDRCNVSQQATLHRRHRRLALTLARAGGRCTLRGRVDNDRRVGQAAPCARARVCVLLLCVLLCDRTLGARVSHSVFWGGTRAEASTPLRNSHDGSRLHVWTQRYGNFCCCCCLLASPLKASRVLSLVCKSLTV